MPYNADQLKEYTAAIGTGDAQSVIDLAARVKEIDRQAAQKKADEELANLAKPRLKTHRLIDIVNTSYPDLMQPVEGLIAEGLTILAGQSKIGKSWLVHNMCLAVAAGKPFLDHKTTAGHVLYLALEDGERRLKSRTEVICKSTGLEVSPLLDCPITAPTVKDGLLGMIETWITEHLPCRLIVIDTLQKVRGITGGRANIYETDSEFMKMFKALADKHHVAIVLVHHLNRRSDSDDPFDRISGSNGLMGTADASIILSRKRGKTEGALTFTGRDLYGDDLVLDFANGVWQVISANAGEYNARKRYDDNEVVKLIKALLHDNPHGIRISYVDVLKESMQRFGGYAAISPKELSRQVRALADELLFYDSIEVKTGLSLKNNSKGIEIMPKLKMTMPAIESEQLTI